MQGRTLESGIRDDVSQPFLHVRRRHMEVEFGSELRERFSSNRKVPLIGLSSKGLLAWSSARILKRRLKIRGNSFGICDLSNKDTLACRPPLTLPCSKSPIREQMGALE